MAATAAPAPDRDSLLADLVQMLCADRARAIRQNNAAVALAASARIADLMSTRRAEAEAATSQPIATLTHRIVYVTRCDRCLECTVSDTPPPPEPEVSRLQRGASGWDDPDPAPQSDPAPPPAPVRQPATIAIPKTPEQMQRRHRRDPVVQGLL